MYSLIKKEEFGKTTKKSEKIGGRCRNLWTREILLTWPYGEVNTNTGNIVQVDNVSKATSTNNSGRNAVRIFNWKYIDWIVIVSAWT